MSADKIKQMVAAGLVFGVLSIPWIRSMGECRRRSS